MSSSRGQRQPESAGNYRAESRPTPDIVLIGQATIDDIHREDGRISLNTPGGAVLYAAVGATMWPVRVGVVTRLGDDYDPSFAEHATAHPDVTDWSGVVFVNGDSIRDIATYHQDGSRTYEFRSIQRLYDLTPVPNDVPPHMFGAPYVHLAPASLPQQLALSEAVRKRGSAVSLDTESHFIRADRALLEPLLKTVDLFIPSVEHLQVICDSEETAPRAFWPWVRCLGPAFVVVKLGVLGSYVFDVRQRLGWHLGIVPGLDVEDVTGAGDAFCGGLLAGLIRSGDLRIAAAHGTVSSSFVIESLGARRPPNFDRRIAAQRLEALARSIPVHPDLLD